MQNYGAAAPVAAQEASPLPTDSALLVLAVIFSQRGCSPSGALVIPLDAAHHHGAAHPVKQPQPPGLAQGQLNIMPFICLGMPPAALLAA